MSIPVFFPGRHFPVPLRRFFATRHMEPGKEKDSNAIMIGSSGGRSCRGTKINGFGITGFPMPRVGSPPRIVGFGPPPAPLPTPSDKKSPDNNSKSAKEKKR